MWESTQDLRRLEATLERSAAEMISPQLKHLFGPDRRLRAADIVALFDRRRVGALATATRQGEPRVAPVDLLLLRGQFLASTSGASLRARHLARRPAVSLTYFDGDDTAVIAHGTARILRPGVTGFDDADAACRAVYGSSVLDWQADGLYLIVEARRMYARRSERS